MESSGDRRLRILPFVYRLLMVVFVSLGLIIIGGTLYKVFFHAIPPSQRPDERIEVSRESGQGQTFTGIGRLRISTADPQPGMVILFVSFVFYPEDKAFSEELALRIKDFRNIITGYIGSFSTAELQKQGEEGIKAELLQRFNAILRLGKIETIYFSDFMIVE